MRKHTPPVTKLAYERVEGVPFLPIPDQRRPLEGFAGVTGGGWMAGVSPSRGLHCLEDAEGPLVLPAPAHWHRAGGPGGWVGAGAWGRPLADGGEERGILLDGLPVLVVQQREGGTSHTAGPARLGGDPVTHLLMADHLSPAVVRSVIQGLLPRMLGRLGRGTSAEGSVPGFALTGFAAAEPVAAARDVLVQLPLNPPDSEPGRGGVPGRPDAPAPLSGLLGVNADGTLCPLTDEAAHEVGLGALMAGEVELAEQILPAVLTLPPSGDVRQAAGRLLFAIAWATWTGRVERLRPFGSHLFAGVEALEAAVDQPLPSSLPAHHRLIEMLADALEPLGDKEAVAFLRGRAEAHAPLPSRASKGGRSLPVLSAGGAGGPGDETLPPRPPEPQLPPLEAFSSPHHPSAQHRAGLHAARMVRSAVAGVLGAVPDAAWGRLRLAPDLTQVPEGRGGVRALNLTGLRVGDSRVQLTCRVQGEACTLAVAQVGGRVPLNLIFEPLLPLRHVARVEMGGEAVQVQIQSETQGTRVRLQFPLDPERSIRIHGEPHVG